MLAEAYHLIQDFAFFVGSRANSRSLEFVRLLKLELEPIKLARLAAGDVIAPTNSCKLITLCVRRDARERLPTGEAGTDEAVRQNFLPIGRGTRVRQKHKISFAIVSGPALSSAGSSMHTSRVQAVSK